MIIKIKKRDLLIITGFAVFAILIPLIYAVGENLPRTQFFKVELAISNRNPTINVSNISAVASSEFGTCKNHSPSNTVVIINCSVVLPYFANASGLWVINISVKDIFWGEGRNDTGTFTINTV